ncbi:MAG: nucleotide excision repair endonuclease [Chitinispirillaceae bacterium]|jgi:hypothetical protein|nr:nucleotide excision repair endonuclease [Chitinispirillaceae bacterium]
MKSGAPTLQDRIVAHLREHPEGVSAAVLAENFLKIKNAAPVAGAAIRAILASDARCFADETGNWHARPADANSAESLAGLPWVAVHGLIDPTARRLLHVSLWEVLPAPSCLMSGWMVDPAASLPLDEQEILQSSEDTPYEKQTAAFFGQSLCEALENKIPVFLSSRSRSLLAAQAMAFEGSLPDDRVLARELLRAADFSCPRPLTIDALENLVFGSEQRGASARGMGSRFAACVAELFMLLGRKGVETRAQLDAGISREQTPLLSGKSFSYDDLLALPSQPGVYGFKNVHGSYCYIGKANNLKRRLLSYFSDTDESPVKLEKLRAAAHSLVTHRCGSELECLITEYRLIRKFSPPLNSKISIAERKGTFRPIDDCVVLLPHADKGKGMSVWFRSNQKILLKSFDTTFPDTGSLIAELNSFFYTPSLPAAASDFPEQEIAIRWIKTHADTLTIVPVSRLSDAKEICDAMRVAWAEVAEA